MIVASPHCQETDPALVAFADRLIRAKVEDEDGEWWDTDSAQFKRAHRAIANRIRFAISGVEPLFSHDEIMVSFSPDLLVDGPDGPYVPGYELQIDTLVPNPEISETPNGSGDWFVRGFEPTEDGVKACIQALIERGFVWDERLQALCEERSDQPSWVTAWMKEGRPGAEAAVEPYAKADREASLENLSQLRTLDELERQLKQSQHLALLFMPATPVMKEGFWRAMGNMSKVYPADLFLVPAGSEVSVGFSQIDGPTVERDWAVTVFVQGKRLDGALGDMFADPYRTVVEQYREPLAPPPPRRNLWAGK
jgi:hypothetical protein